MAAIVIAEAMTGTMTEATTPHMVVMVLSKMPPPTVLLRGQTVLDRTLLTTKPHMPSTMVEVIPMPRTADTPTTSPCTSSTMLRLRDKPQHRHLRRLLRPPQVKQPPLLHHPALRRHLRRPRDHLQVVVIALFPLPPGSNIGNGRKDNMVQMDSTADVETVDKIS